MNRTRTLALVLAAALPMLAVAQQPAFKNFREALNAADQAFRGKQPETALQHARAALTLAGEHSGDRAQALERIARAHTDLGQWTDLIAALKPEVMACTNFSLAHPSLRKGFASLARAAIKAGDPETFKGLDGALAREAVTDQTFALWRDVAMILAQEALDLRKTTVGKAAEHGIAGFREGSSTFGLWQQPLEVDGQILLDATRLAEAGQLLTRQMPQAGLSPKFQFLRDRALLDIQMLAGNEEGRAKVYAALEKQAFGFKPADQEGTNVLEQAFNALVAYHEQRLDWIGAANAVKTRAAKRPDTVGPRLPSMIGRAAGYYFRAGADTLHEAELARLAALPFSDEVFKGYMEMAGIINRQHNAIHNIPRLLKPLSDRRASLTPEQRHALAGWLLDAALRGRDVKAARENMAELVALDAAYHAGMAEEDRKSAEARERNEPYTRRNPPRTVLNNHQRNRYGTLLLEERALPEAIKAYEERVVYDSRNPDAYLGLAVARLLDGKDQEAREGLDVFVTNTALRAESRFAGRVLQEVVAARDPDDFRRRVMALRPLCDAEGGEGEKPEAAEARFFNWLRSASRQVFATEKVDYVLAMQACSESLKHPEIRLAYTARYLENAPSSAESWMRSGILADDTRAERRFGRYAMFASNNKASELAMLKSRPAPVLDDCEKGKEGGIIFAYDERGIHIYIQFNDPAAREIRDGLRGGASLELTVSPGDAYSYHQTFYNTTDATDHFAYEWDTAHVGYKLTADYVRNDCCQTDTATAGYTFMPWLMFHDKLPGHGSKWRVVLAAGWAGQFRSLGGGAVHELGRGLEVTFDMPPAIAARIRASVVRSAVGEYRRIRRQWENAGFWSDPHMGDEPFAEAVVKPFLKTLDEAAAVVEDTSKPLTQAQVDQFFKEMVPQWADFRLRLDALRADYLEARFFK